ncbi:MAG: hypothetical protein V3T74_08650 [Gemmatimonadales bacterium]|jgi:hypothetical protein
MRAKLPLALALGVLLLSPLAATAQDDQPSMIRAMYYWCDQSKEARADEIVEQTIGPVYDQLLASGDISAWGWLIHTHGGKWRRVAYWAAESQDALLDATEKLIAALPEDDMEDFNAICPGHDDYIWWSIGGSSGTEIPSDRAEAGLSTYYQCDMNTEADADELMLETFGPVLDNHVKAGGFNSWTWLGHAWGGKVRRLLAFDGADHKSILNTHAAAFAEIGNANPAALEKFVEICPVHEDYLWNIAQSKP